MEKRILCINPGSTSTRIAVFCGKEKIFSCNVSHTNEELDAFDSVQEQLDYRYGLIVRTLREKGVDIRQMDAIVGRGGALRPMAGGVFAVNEAMLEDCRNSRYAEHPSNLGCQLAYRFAEPHGIPCFVVDPPLMDEFDPVSRLSGFPPLRRVSAFHALNERIVARYISQELQRPLEELNLVTVHLGSGVSVTAQRGGRCVDNTYGSGGDGPFSPERAGRMAGLELLRYMASVPGFREKSWKKMFSKQSGLVSWLGTNNVIEITDRMEKGDPLAGALLDGMAYMISREIAAFAAGLDWSVDAIGITGAIARSDYIVGAIRRQTEFLAKVFVYPGEFEMEGLADGGNRALSGKEKIKVY